MKTFEKLWKKTIRKNNCWIFKTVNKSNGYGEIMFNYKKYLTHRLAYELVKGPIPKGLQIDHLCRNRACINPDHLEAVTRKENLLRGMSFSGINSRKTKCKNGHPFSEDNILPGKIIKTHRRCRTCARKRTQNWKDKNPDYWK